VDSGGSTRAALPIVRHRQGWLGLLHRLDAVARSVLLASVDVQRRQESRCTEQDKMLSRIVITCFELACCAEWVLQRATNGRQPSIIPLCKDRLFRRAWGSWEGEIWVRGGGLKVLWVIGVLDFIGRSLLNYGLLPKTIDP